MTRLYGSSDLFPDDTFHAFRPFQSVNYISSHDGFTMYDLVAYSEKHNEANGHSNQDGPSEHSFNSGWEGDEQAPREVLDLRKRQVKNFCCLLMLSAGTPMFRMGDEFMQTQHGNNNPYNQDNETTWLDWQRLKENEDVFSFFKRMIAFRKSHPSLGRSTFWRDAIRWFGAEHTEVDMTADPLALAYHLRAESPIERDLYVIINGSGEQRTFNLHTDAANGWLLAIDTSLPSPLDIANQDNRVAIEASAYQANPRSIVVLEDTELATHISHQPY